MPRTFTSAVLLALAVGCSFDFAHKTACESQSDCLNSYVCEANLCVSPTMGGSTAGVAGVSPAGGKDRPASGGTASLDEGGGSVGGEDPVAMAGTSGDAGGTVGAEGGTGAAEGGTGAAEGGADPGGAAGCDSDIEPSKTAEVAYLLHPHPSISSIRFGRAVAVDGDTVVANAFNDEAVFIYVKTECGWSFQAELNADDKVPGMSFGHAVAIQGDTVIVGAPFAGVTPSPGAESIQAGAVYVFERSAGSWTQTAKLKAHNAGDYDLFGTSVALDGDRLAVGAPGEDSASRTINTGSDDDSLESDGAAYVFSRVAGEWAEAAYLKREGDGSGGDLNGGIGVSIAVSGSRVVVGSPGTDAGGFTDAGAAYVFNEDSGIWTLEQTLWVRSQLTATEARSKFGMAVAVSGNIVAVGAPDGGEGEGLSYGTASVFGYSQGTGWYLATRLGNYARNGDFGASVALRPGRLLVGDPLEINAGKGIDAAQSSQISVAVGAAYLFELDPNTWRWERTHYIKASNASQYDQFGTSVALSSDLFVVGAPQRHSAPEDLYSSMDKYRFGPGASYVFQIVP
jgi:hypothetical protein